MAIEIEAALSAIGSISSAIEDMGAAMGVASLEMASKGGNAFEPQQRSASSTEAENHELQVHQNPQSAAAMLPTHLLDNPRAISGEIFRRYSTSEYRRAAEMHDNIAKWLQMHSLQTGAAVDHKISQHKHHSATFHQLARLRMTRIERWRGFYGVLGGHAGALNVIMLIISILSSCRMIWKMITILLSRLLASPSHIALLGHLLHQSGAS